MLFLKIKCRFVYEITCVSSCQGPSQKFLGFPTKEYSIIQKKNMEKQRIMLIYRPSTSVKYTDVEQKHKHRIKQELYVR